MTTIIDRRLNGKGKSLGSRQKFIKRAYGQIKDAVRDAVDKKAIRDIGDNETSITIPSRDLSEPHFHHGRGGKKEFVLPGNHDKVVGDRIPKPRGGDGEGGPNGSPDGEGTDDFTFTLSRDEFLDFFFDDLELPNMVKTKLKEINSVKPKKSGLTTSGMPSNLNIIRSMKNAIGRKIALESPYQEEIDELLFKLALSKGTDKKEILERIEFLENEKKTVPFIDDIDIRYNSFENRPNPTTQAVMFCLMDVSGSMAEYEKELSKRFFMLLYLFLNKHYEKIEIVFIRHTTSAKECNEHDFFYSQESGGTIVSSALKLTYDTIKKRYDSSDWNIYIAQASDGDNWDEDNKICEQVISEDLMPLVQYFAYVQIGREKQYNMWGGFNSDKPLWTSFQKLTKTFDNFQIDQIDSAKDIFPVFKRLFKKKGLE